MESRIYHGYLLESVVLEHLALLPKTKIKTTSLFLALSVQSTDNLNRLRSG